MWIIFIGEDMHSAWDNQTEAASMKQILLKMGKERIEIMLREELRTCFHNGYRFS